LFAVRDVGKSCLKERGDPLNRVNLLQRVHGSISASRGKRTYLITLFLWGRVIHQERK